METPKDPKARGQINPDKITNQPDKIVNKRKENLHEATNEEQWAHDVNEEFGDDFVLPDEDDDEEL
ncbi:hypothetical protein [Pelobium manganitolerans]|uniref:hypothetical protein n=1 Tax=Pelobium manganitolerans TaxID=1842495 RepID=UPI003FA3CD16